MHKAVLEDTFLQSEALDGKDRLYINPNNVFWAITSKQTSSEKNNKEVVSLHKMIKPKIDAQMHDFRFSSQINTVYINPTDICNASCPYCYIPVENRTRGKQMSGAQLLYVLNKIEKYFQRRKRHLQTKPMIIYHASEPLLAKDIVFASIKKFSKKFYFGIQTNALLLEKKDVDFLKSYQVSVGISLDSAVAEINDATRGGPAGGNYKKAIKAINWFDGYAGLSVITTINKYNVRRLPGLVRLLHAKKVPCVLLNPVRITRKTTYKIRPNETEMVSYFIKSVKEAMLRSKKSNRRIIIGNFSNIILAIVAPTARRLMCDISPCGGGRCFFTITASGQMIPCGEFIGIKEFSGGNIFNSSIPKALSSKAFKKVTSRVVENIAECDICNYRNICGAPCPAELYALKKNMHQVSIYCKFYKQIIRYAFKLIAQGDIECLFRKDALKNIKYEYRLKDA